MGQIISIQTFILGILGTVNRNFKRNDEANTRQELENNLKNLRVEHMNLSYIYVEQKHKIMAHAIKMEQFGEELSKTFDSIQDIEADDVAANNGTKVDIAFKRVENTLRTALFDIRSTQAEIISHIEALQLQDLHQEEPRHVEAVKLVASLKSIFNDFAHQMSAINNLKLNQRISKLEQSDGVLKYLKEFTQPRLGSMYSLLTDLIDRQFTIPQHKDDNLSLGMLDLLCTGVDVYLYMLAFALQQYTILCNTYYHKNDLDKYNSYYLEGANAFSDLTNTLIDLSDKVVNGLYTVEKLEFIRIYKKNVTKFIARKLDKFKPIKKFLLDNYQTLVKVDKQENFTPKLDYASSKIETPILEWTSGSVLSYAIMFMGNSVEPFSVTSDWSNDKIGRFANPSVSIYRDPLKKIRVIFRLIGNGTAQIVAIIKDAEQEVFRDIDRDLYNAVLKLNEKDAIKYVKNYLENGANASAVFENNRRAIHAAAQNNQWAVAEELIKSDSNMLNAIDDNGYSPIYIASHAGHQSFVQNLLNIKGIDVNVPTSKKNHQLTALHCAVYKGHVNIVRQLMQFPLIDVNAKTTDGFTALHIATYNNSTEIISMLSNYNRTDFNVFSGQIEIPLNLSLDGGATYDKHVESFVNSGNVSPLEISLAFSTKPVVESILLNSKMQTIHSKTSDGSNVLHFAAFNQEFYIIPAFEEHMNIKQTVSTQNDHEYTPLYNAYYRDNLHMCHKLISCYCANEDIRLNNNKTMLHLAVIHGHVSAANSLLHDRNANVLAIDALGRTPLHYAVWLGDVEMVQTLLRNGAKPNTIDFIGIPDIHLAINLTEDKALSIIRMLVKLDENLNLNLKGTFGNTLLHYMCALEYVSVVKYLLTIPNIDIHVVNDQKETILHVAAFVGNLELVRMVFGAYDHHNNATDCITTLCFAIKGKGTLEIVEYLEDIHPGLIGPQELKTSVKMHKNDIFHKYEYFKWDKKLRDIFLTSLEFANCNIAQYCFRDGGFGQIFPDSVIEPEKNWTALYYILAHGGDSKMIECIIDNAPDYIATLEVVDRVDGKTLLHLAIENGHIDAVDLLLDLGAPFDNADKYGNTQLHLAAQCGLNAVVKRLLEKGAIKSINMKNMNGKTPLYLATEGYGTLELVKYLLDFGANLDNPKHQGTLVNAAAWANKSDLAMYFISLNVDYIMADDDRVTPLHNAAKNNNLDLVNYLLDQDKIDVNVVTKDLQTPIYYAIQYHGDINVVNSLLDKFATISVDLGKCDNLLTLAIEQNKIEIAQTLILADVYINWDGVSMKTPLYQAIYSDNVEMVKLLLESGADLINAHGPGWNYAVDMMIQNSCDRSIKFYAYDYKDKHNQTLLHLMAAQNNVNVVKTMLERGAYVDVQDTEGNSPLHLAAKNGHLKTVQKMCEMKQNCIHVELLNANKQTALDLARLNNKTEVVEFLEQWHPKQRARRQIVEQFSVPLASSSAGRTSWWVSDFVGAAVGTLGIIIKHCQSVLFSSYHESASPQSISTPFQSVNVHGTLLLLDVLVRKFTSQTYIDTDSQSFSPMDARSNSLAIVQQFERMLNRIANETKSQFVFELDSFELYRTVERCLLSGQYNKIYRVLLSTARDAFSYDSVEDSFLVINVKELFESRH